MVALRTKPLKHFTFSKPKLEKCAKIEHMPSKVRLKDEQLNIVSKVANVAQFVSCGPGADPKLRFVNLRGGKTNNNFFDIKEAIEFLLEESDDGLINIRSFKLGQSSGNPFYSNIRDVDDAMSRIRKLASDGYYTIANEFIDINDGGISGVAWGDVVEFAPKDTPRCVEKPGVATMNRAVAWKLFSIVYGFEPKLPFDNSLRVEFSIHPRRRGLLREHTIIWEVNGSKETPSTNRPQNRWPNRFSRFLGDKAFGLLVAHIFGIKVPFTSVISRRVSPFGFGHDTGSKEIWMRTCPPEQVPGKFPTEKGWNDPLKLMTEIDPDGTLISSILAQKNVLAEYSGSVITGRNETPIIEGVRGEGDRYMQGTQPSDALPNEVIKSVLRTYAQIVGIFGPVAFEWCYAEKNTWLLQLHIGSSQSTEECIYPGDTDQWFEFDPMDGLEALRIFIGEPLWGKKGIILTGNVGMTSHFTELLRKAKIPSKFKISAK